MKTLGLHICIRNHEGAFKPSRCCERRFLTLTVMAPYTIIALMVSISREMANPTQAFSAMTVGGGGRNYYISSGAVARRASGDKSS